MGRGEHRDRRRVAMSLLALLAAATMAPGSVLASYPTVPGPVVLLGPAPYAASSNDPVLSWTATPGAVGYEVQMWPIPLVGIGPTVSSETWALQYPVPELAPGPYVWTVRAVGTERRVGPATAPRVFTKRPRLTTAPALIAPASGTTFTAPDGLGVLRWTPVPDASSYQVDISMDPSFPGPDPDPGYGGIATEGLVVTADGNPNLHYWRVRALTAARSNPGPWSTVRSYRVLGTAVPPMPDPAPTDFPAPILLSPADGATSVDLTRTPIHFASVPGTIGYDVQIVPVDQDWYTIGAGPPTALTTTRIPILDHGVTYKWRARVNDTNGIFNAGPWSAERTFSTPPLGGLTLTAPPNGAVVTNERLLLMWAARPASPEYTIELSRTPDFAQVRTTTSYADARVDLGGQLPTGLWYWRVRAGRSQIAAVSPVRSLTVVDDAAPVGAVGYPYDFTAAETITLEGRAEDAVSEVDRTAVSPDGVDWTEFDYGQQPVWSLTSADHGGSDPGPREIWMRWRDTAGNWSLPTVNRFQFAPSLPVDTVAPVSTKPTVAIIAGGSITPVGKVPIRIDWRATDANGISRHELSEQVDGSDGWHIVPFDDPYSSPPPLAVTLATQHSYQFMDRAADGAGNVGAYAVGPRFRLARIGERGNAVSYRGAWRAARSAAYWQGQGMTASKAGATATVTFSGRSIAIVSLRGPTRGAATIYVNGTRVVTIDLYARTFQARSIVWSMDWSTSAARTVTVRVDGTAGRPRVDIDGFVTIR